MNHHPDNDARYDDTREIAAPDCGDRAACRRDARTISPAEWAKLQAIHDRAEAERAYCALQRKYSPVSRPADVAAEMDRLAKIAWPS